MLAKNPASPLAAIDRAAEDFGMPMGPIELIDSVGLDVALHVSAVLGDGIRPRSTRTTILQRLVDEGRLGRKNGHGFYEWDRRQSGQATRRRRQGTRQYHRPTDPAMVNEAVACLS